jgi:hypothetical protein
MWLFGYLPHVSEGVFALERRKAIVIEQRL